MKTAKRTSWLCLLLCLLLLATALAGTSCKKKPETDPSATTPPTNEDGSTVEANPLEALPTADFEDRDFVIASPGYTQNWAEEELGDSMAEIAFKRTLGFEERYKCTVYSSNFASPMDMYNTMMAVHQSQEPEFDLLFPHPTAYVPLMLTQGYMADVSEITTMNLTGPWYNTDQVLNYTVNGKLYLVASDTTICNQGFFALAYNRAVMANYSFESDVKTLVDDGNWTMEALNEMITVTEANADSADPTYGLIFNSAPIARWMYAMGENILVLNKDGYLEKSLKNSKMVDIAEEMDNLLYGHGDAVMVGSSFNAGLLDSEMYKKFGENRGLFITWDIGSCYEQILALDLDLGYAPLPKFDSKQKDYRVFCASGLLAIPSVAHSLEESGMGMEYFAVYSYINLKPEFYRIILGGRLADVPEDLEMLELLHSHKVYDYGYTLDESEELIYLLKTAVIDNKNPSGIQVIIKTSQNTIDKLLELAEGLV